MARSVQDYIDETPRWSDGTGTTSAPMTAMQWRIWGLATAGKFFEGMVVFMTGVALPLIALEFDLGATQKGMVGAASLFGILVGATALGPGADSWAAELALAVRARLSVATLADHVHAFPSWGEVLHPPALRLAGQEG